MSGWGTQVIGSTKSLLTADYFLGTEVEVVLYRIIELIPANFI